MKDGEHNGSKTFWTLVALMVAALLINMGTCRGQYDPPIPGPEFFIGVSGGTWGEEPNFGSDLRMDYGPIVAEFGYVFATTQRETFHLAMGVNPYENEWYAVNILWGVVLNDLDVPKLIIDNYFKIAPGGYITAGMESVYSKIYWNVGISLRIDAPLFKKDMKAPRFF